MPPIPLGLCSESSKQTMRLSHDDVYDITVTKCERNMPIMPKPTRMGYLPPKPEREAQGRRLHANTAFYQSQPWRRVRKRYLASHPLCAECVKQGRITAARVVDHIVPINQGGARFDSKNLQGLCDSCHNKKSGREAHAKKE